MIHNDRLWQTELGSLNWVFVQPCEGARSIGGARQPWNYPVDGVTYMLVTRTAWSWCRAGPTRSPPLWPTRCCKDSCFVIAGGALYRTEMLLDGLSHVNGLFVRGDDVFVSLAGEPFIIQQNASRHHRCPQATRLCAKVSDQGDSQEALEQERGESPGPGGSSSALEQLYRGLLQ